MAVYPRWRGEHAAIIQKRTQGIGLSPLARGTRLNMYIYSLPYPVYPRWRGEHCWWWVFYSWRTGLSPLARGTRQAAPSGGRGSRFIPAGAGNTIEIVFGIYSEAVYPRWRGEHSKHNLLLINDFLSQSQSTNFIVSHKQHIHYVKEHLIHWLKR